MVSRNGWASSVFRYEILKTKYDYDFIFKKDKLYFIQFLKKSLTSKFTNKIKNLTPKCTI
jgi:hypothetical protein